MRRLDHVAGQLLRALPIACFAGLFGLLFVNVVARTLQLAGFAWFDEIVQGLFAWMVFMGAAALWREHEHFRVDWLPDSLPPRASRLLRIVVVLLSLCFLVAMTWYGLSLARKARAVTPILSLPTALFYAAIPVSGAVMTAYSLADLVRLLRRKEP